ncbi:MAG: hypothetical protein ACE3JQ_12575 [Paenisporosarcina sp.]
MKNVFASVKGKVLVGVLAIGVVGAGAASASGFGFIGQLQNILNGTTDNVATYSADAVNGKDKNNVNYTTKITNDVNSAAHQIKTQLQSEASKEITRGKTETDAHYEQLKNDLNAVKDSTISSGKTKITNAVNTKVSLVKSQVEDAAVTAINAQLNTDTHFTGTGVVSK